MIDDGLDGLAFMDELPLPDVPVVRRRLPARLSRKGNPNSRVRKAYASRGDDLLLDTEGDRDEADEELRDKGWAFRPVDVVRFPADYSGTRKQRVEYHEHDCPDCV